MNALIFFCNFHTLPQDLATIVVPVTEAICNFHTLPQDLATIVVPVTEAIVKMN